MSKIETLRWVDDHFEMIDKRILPEKFEYITYTTAASVAEGIKSMVVRGAPAIGCAAAYGVAIEAIRLRSLDYKSFLDQLNYAYDLLL